MFDFTMSAPESPQTFTPDYVPSFPMSRELGVATTMPYNSRPYQHHPLSTSPKSATTTPVDDAEIVTIVHSLMEEQSMTSPCLKTPQRSRDNVTLVSCCTSEQRKARHTSAPQNTARYSNDTVYLDYQPQQRLKTLPTYSDSVRAATTSPFKMNVKMETGVEGDFISVPCYSGANCCGNSMNSNRMNSNSMTMSSNSMHSNSMNSNSMNSNSMNSMDRQQWEASKDCRWSPQAIAYTG